MPRQKKPAKRRQRSPRAPIPPNVETTPIPNEDDEDLTFEIKMDNIAAMLKPLWRDYPDAFLMIDNLLTHVYLKRYQPDGAQ